MASVTRGDKKCFFLVRFQNQNREMDAQKMPMQTLPDIYKKYWLYLALSNRFAKLCHHIVT